MPSWKKVIVSGSDATLNSLNVTNGVTGSLFGTASYSTSASQAITSSFSNYAVTASSALNSEDILIYVKNSTGAQINKGTVVRINGAVGDNPLISTASYEADGLSANTLGITNQNIPNDDFGYVMTEGKLLGINTNAFSAGQLLYLGANGTITGSAPQAPLHAVRLGQVLRVQAINGSMYVRIDNGYELGELHDVIDSTTTSSYGDLLVKSGSVWINSRQLTGSYGLTGSLQATSFTGSLFGTSSYATSASQAISASRATNAGNASTIDINLFGNPVDSYLLMSNVAGTTGVAVGADADLRYNANTNVLTLTGTINASSFTGSLLGTASYATSASQAISSSFAVNASSSLQATNALSSSKVRVSDLNTTSTPQYVTFVSSQTDYPTMWTDVDLTYVPNTNTLSVTSSYTTLATNALSATSASQAISSSFAVNASSSLFAVSSSRAISASFATVASSSLFATSASQAASASFVNTLNQNIIVTGSAAIGATSGASENTLTLGARDNGSEGGQLGFNAPGGVYTSASMLDNYQNRFRILRGTNAGSDAEIAWWSMHTKQMALPAYTGSGAFPGTTTGILGVDSSGNIVTTTAGGTGTVTQVNTSGTVNGLTLTGGPIISTGTVTLGGTLSNILTSSLAQSGSTIGSTFVGLGSTVTTLAGLSSVTSTNFTGTASYATSASQAISSSFAVNASSSLRALTANSATSATSATSASYATIASSSLFATSASTATLATSADTVKTSLVTTNATHYLTYVPDNNGSPTAELLGTVGTLTFNPNTGVLAANNFTGTASYATSASQAISSSFAAIAQSVLGTITNASTASNITPAITNAANNRVLTANGGGTINGEQNLTFDGTTLVVSGSLNNGSPLNIASGINSHVEGELSTSAGDYSHAEGYGAQATGIHSHAEGRSTSASGAQSHAEGFASNATGLNAHAEGYFTIAEGSVSHAEGDRTYAGGFGSHAAGYYTSASGDYQSVIGQYNLPLTNSGAFIIGNGTGVGARSNLLYASGSQVQITGSLVVTGGITGSFSGTTTSASYANIASSSLFATTAGTATSATSATSASMAVTVGINNNPSSGGGPFYVPFVASAAGNATIQVDNSTFIYAPSTNTLTVDNLAGTASYATTSSRALIANSATSATSAGSVTNAVTFNNGGAGDASGTTFNGSAARTISYNSIGAPSTGGTGATGTWGIGISGNAATATSASYATVASSSLFATTAGTATTATNATNVAVTDTTSGTGPYYLMFADGTTGNRATRVDSSTLTFNATTNTITVTNLTGTASFATTASHALGAVSSGIIQQGGKSYVTHDFNSYPNVYDTTFINPIGSTNLPTNMSSVMSYRFIMGGGDTTARGVDLVVAAESSGNMYMRERSIGTWSRMLHSNNFNSYSPTLTGTGASGTWGIGISGNASTATSASMASAVAITNQDTTPVTYNLTFVGATSGNQTLSTDSTALLYTPSSGIFETPIVNSSTGVRGGNGSASTPAFSFSGDTNTGMYNITADTLGFATNGGERVRITAAGAMGLGITPTNTSGRFEASNDIVAFSTSDKRWKNNIVKIDSPLEKISQISGVEFDWIEDEPFHGNKGHDVGVIAQEIELVIPEAVQTRESGMKAVQYDKIIPLLIESIKEQQKQIDELKELVNKLTK